MARPIYEHRQTGWWMRIGLLAGAVLLVGMTALGDLRDSPSGQVALLLGAMLAVAIGWLWSSLTVRIADSALRLQFGLGLPRKTVPLADLESVEVTRTRFIDGWGVHWTRRGWLYNVSGFDAVLLRRKDGKALLVGTDEPRKLKAALERALTTAG
jgi:hypothetical protein